MKNAHTKNADLMEISFTTSGTIQKGKVAGWDLYRGNGWPDHHFAQAR
jgi:hypothetical protein